MDSVIHSIRTPRRVSIAQIEKTEKQIVNALLSNDSVFDGKETHSFEDSLQVIWNDESKVAAIEAEFKRIAKGESRTTETIRAILIAAIETYAESISYRVAQAQLNNTMAEVAGNYADESIRGRI